MIEMYLTGLLFLSYGFSTLFIVCIFYTPKSEDVD